MTNSQLWPQLGESSRLGVNVSIDLFPGDIDALRKLSVCKVKVNGSNVAGYTWAGRKGNIIEHFRALEAEFNGAPCLSHLYACVIVALRRKPDDEDLHNYFIYLTEEFCDVLSRSLNIRWLTSVCDTVLDLPIDRCERATALTGTMLANIIKLSETERQLFLPSQFRKNEFCVSRGGEIFDGMITFWTTQGDMIENLMGRALDLLEEGGLVAPYVAEILVKVLENDTVIKRLAKLRGLELPSVVGKDFDQNLDKVLRQFRTVRID